ncbi:unnamed protein product [Meganyctiphanes norvegica]|uniref:C2H2-type domain-containing protein n=1 Tax=Meganyctiphanes norvegica TaxID=48144 RepID=A0AAV2RD04_MEGNR
MEVKVEEHPIEEELNQHFRKPGLFKQEKASLAFQCSQCDKSFKNKCIHMKHQTTCTGELQCQCSICGRSFTQKAELVKHQITHTGEKPLQCSQCNKSFSQKVSPCKPPNYTHWGEAISV